MVRGCASWKGLPAIRNKRTSGCAATAREKRQAMRPANPLSVVTGATGGIGGAIRPGLGGAGFHVVGGSRKSAKDAEVLASSLPGDGHCAACAPVTDSAALRA